MVNPKGRSLGPQPRTSKPSIRIAAIGDIHCNKASQGVLAPLLSQMSDRADVLLVCGDLTDYGLPEEADIFAREWAATVTIPTVAVLGNHDYESGQADAVQKILSDAGLIILDGDSCEVRGVGFAGVKGFAGGFGNRALQPWGEECIKRFVREGVDEALKLESALARLGTAQRIAVLHYAPIRETVEGEPAEIIPFLGSSRLEAALDRYPVNAVFHGHAHHGCPYGETKGTIPVYNVAMPLLRRLYPDRLPFHLFELPAVPTTVE